VTVAHSVAAPGAQKPGAARFLAAGLRGPMDYYEFVGL